MSKEVFISGKIINYKTQIYTISNQLPSLNNCVVVFSFPTIENQIKYVHLEYFDLFNKAEYNKLNFGLYNPAHMFAYLCNRKEGETMIKDVIMNNPFYIGNL